MVKLSASLSKKVPMPDVEHSSRCCSAGIEVAHDAKAEQLLARLRQLYTTLEVAVDEQLNAPRNGQSDTAGASNGGNEKQSRYGNTNGSRNGNGRMATEAQQRAIEAIARDKGIDGPELQRMLISGYGAGLASELTVKEASAGIGQLKNGK